MRLLGDEVDSQYQTLLVALLLSYEWSAPGYHGSFRDYWPTAVLFAFPLGVLGAVPWLTFSRLHWAEVVAGVTLMGYAWRTVQRHRVRHARWFSALDAASACLALTLAGADPLAIAAGVVAGLLLPVATGPWPEPLRAVSHLVETLWLGAVGMRTVVAILAGLPGDFLPWWVWVIPWLIVWDLSARGGATA
ncbi:MAG: hypothetical protein OWU84_13080 [Firmicutes bacterium]|nr:hypothetical protein [Bacillota bacterium]